MKSFLNKIGQADLPAILFVLYIGKLLILGTSGFDAIAATAISALFGFKLYLDHIKKPDYNQQLNERLEQINSSHETRLLNIEAKISNFNMLFSRQQKQSEGSNEFKWGR